MGTKLLPSTHGSVHISIIEKTQIVINKISKFDFIEIIKVFSIFYGICTKTNQVL